MKYVARYTQAAQKAAMEAAIGLVRANHFYATYPREDPAGRQSGAQVNGRRVWRDSSGGQWRGYYIPPARTYVEELGEFDPPAEWFAGKTVSWRTCAGNYLEIAFEEDGTVLITAEGRRHGIPSAQILADLDPYLDEVLEYTTQEPDWKPWETLNDQEEA